MSLKLNLLVEPYMLGLALAQPLESFRYIGWGISMILEQIIQNQQKIVETGHYRPMKLT